MQGLTVYAFPRSLHKKIRANNGVENLNARSGAALEWWESSPISTRRCEISAVLAEIHDEWLTGRCYLNLESWQEEEAS